LNIEYFVKYIKGINVLSVFENNISIPILFYSLIFKRVQAVDIPVENFKPPSRPRDMSLKYSCRRINIPEYW